MTRIVFMGTPDFAVPALRALLDAPEYQVVGVVTQPDRPAGRGGQVAQSPVKQAALAAGLPVLQPEKLRTPDAMAALSALLPDLIVVAAFGQILRQNVLDMPRYGCINIHASLLPRWRGAAPIQAALRAGDPETGISIMKMDAGLDTGPVLGMRGLPIERDDTGQTLHDRLAVLGGELLLELLGPYLRGQITPQAQDNQRHTYAPMLKKEDGLIDWSLPAVEIERMVRAYHPWPGAYTLWKGQLLKLLPGESDRLPRTMPGQALFGEVVSRGPGLVGIGTGDGLYVPRRVQIAGRPATAITAFINGHPDFVAARLGSGD